MQHSPTSAVLSSSFNLNHASPTAPSWTHQLQDSGSHTAVSVWVVSQKDWRNQADGWIQAKHLDSIVGKCNFRVSPFYQVVQKHKLIDVAYTKSVFWLLTLSVTFLPKISKSVHMCQSSSKPKVGRFFETRCRHTLPVFTGRINGPWTRVVCTDLNPAGPVLVKTTVSEQNQFHMR